MDCAFVGAGRVAERYAAEVEGPPLRLTAVCDPDGDRAERLATSDTDTGANEVGAAPAEVALAWNVRKSVVPVPSSPAPEHAVSNLTAARHWLDVDVMTRLDGFADPGFER